MRNDTMESPQLFRHERSAGFKFDFVSETCNLYFTVVSPVPDIQIPFVDLYFGGITRYSPLIFLKLSPNANPNSTMVTKSLFV